MRILLELGVLNHPHLLMSNTSFRLKTLFKGDCTRMNILIAVVHHWNPEGGGNHQSLRPDPNPRINALQDQILSLKAP